MKRFIFIFTFVSVALFAWSNDSISTERPYILDDMPNAHIYQDSILEARLREKIYGGGEFVEVDGYRVQIFSSNRQQTAKEEALRLEKKMSDLLSVPVYVMYIAPFWKVRLGNFQTYEEANSFKAKVVAHFSEMQGDTYIVRDKIQVIR